MYSSLYLRMLENFIEAKTIVLSGETIVDPGFSQLFPGEPESSAAISPYENAKMALPKNEPIYNDVVCPDNSFDDTGKY